MADTRLDPDGWSGEPEELVPVTDEILYDPEICDRLFATKHEAFGAGYFLGHEAAQGLAAPTLGNGQPRTRTNWTGKK